MGVSAPLLAPTFFSGSSFIWHTRPEVFWLRLSAPPWSSYSTAHSDSDSTSCFCFLLRLLLQLRGFGSTWITLISNLIVSASFLLFDFGLAAGFSTSSLLFRPSLLVLFIFLTSSFDFEEILLSTSTLSFLFSIFCYNSVSRTLKLCFSCSDFSFRFCFFFSIHGSRLRGCHFPSSIFPVQHVCL